LIYGKNFCKCHNVPSPSTTIKISKINIHLKMKDRKVKKQVLLGTGTSEKV
jgi:hypothetical protein